MLDQLHAILRDDSMFTPMPEAVSEGRLEEREVRYVSVLFADVKGFTTLSEKLHHEVVQDLMDKLMYYFSQRVEKYGGYVDKYEGDRIMAHFGSKEFLEQTSRRAVYAGLELIDVIRRFNEAREALPELAHVDADLAIRVGVNSGKVTTGRVGMKREGDFTIYGDVVNTASRMEETGVLNSVMMPEAVKDELQDYFFFEFRGDMTVKGKQRPIACWLTKKARQRQVGRVVSDTVFLGRIEELAQLRALYDGCRANLAQKHRDRKVDVVGVKGQAGIGKSRFLHEFIASLDRNAVCMGEASPVSQAPYHAICLLLRSVLRIPADSSVAFVRQRVARMLDRFAACCPASLAEQLPQAGVAWRCLLGDRAAVSQTEQTNGERADNVKTAVLFLLQAAAWRLKQNGLPLVVVLDDLHWADEASLDIAHYAVRNFHHIALETDDSPLQPIFILLYRNNHLPSASLRQQARFHEITLEELGDFHIHHMINDLLADCKFPYEIKQQLVKYSAGNPLYVEEWAKYVKEELQCAPNIRMPDLPIPRDIHSLILARANTLGDDCVRLLQSAAAVGYEFLASMFEELNRRVIGVGNLDEQMETLLRSHLLAQTRLSKDTRLRFSHQLVRDALYDTLLHHNRKVIGREVARIIEEDPRYIIDDHIFDLAQFYRLAGDRESELHYAKLAQKRARDMYLFGRALTYNQRVLELESHEETPGPLLDRVELLLETGKYGKAWEALRLARERRIPPELRHTDTLLEARLLLAAGDAAKAGEVLAGALDGIEDRDRKIAALLLRFDIRRNDLDDERYIPDADEFLDSLKHRPIDQARLLNMMGLHHRRKARYAKAADCFGRAMKLCGENYHLLRRIHQNLGGVCAKLGDKPQAIEHYHKALSLARRIDDVGGCGKALTDLATVYMGMNKTAKALSMLEESLELARATGNRRLEGLVAYNIAVNHYHLESNTKAREYLRASIRICRELKDHPGVAHANDLLGDIFYQEGMFARAKKVYEDNLAIQTKLGDEEGVAHTYGNLGNVAVEEGELTSAEGFYRLQQEMLHRIGDKEGEAKAWFNWGLLDADRERLQDAKEKVERALGLFDEIQANIYIDEVKNYLAELQKYIEEKE